MCLARSLVNHFTVVIRVIDIECEAIRSDGVYL